jgi:hypothetical protein
MLGAGVYFGTDLLRQAPQQQASSMRRATACGA